MARSIPSGISEYLGPLTSEGSCVEDYGNHPDLTAPKRSGVLQSLKKC